MAIGSSKIGVLGGLVPGGSETFNASGAFIVPPGVRTVNITGRGATGNPGNSGNSGNTGNPGTGGGGGAGGAASGFGTWTPIVFYCCNPLYNRGGFAYTQQGLTANSWPPVDRINEGNYGNAGQTGTTGNAGNAGTAGNPGSTGTSSSGLLVTFPGGAGGNAGNAGNAGTGGSGGTGGALGGSGVILGAPHLNPFPGSINPDQSGTGGPGGAAGNAAGAGGRGTQRGFIQGKIGGAGGGGAGVNNPGNPALNAYPFRTSPNPCPSRGFMTFGDLPNNIEPAPAKVQGLISGGAGAGNEVRAMQAVSLPPIGINYPEGRWFLGYGGRGLSSFNASGAPGPPGNAFMRTSGYPGSPPIPASAPAPGAPFKTIMNANCAITGWPGWSNNPNISYPLISSQSVPTCTIGNMASFFGNHPPGGVPVNAVSGGSSQTKGMFPSTSPWPNVGQWVSTDGSWRAGGGGGFGQALRGGNPGTVPGPFAPGGVPYPSALVLPLCRNAAGGGGGGGGRGNLFNPAGTGGTGGTGLAATPSTTNCVPVVPGSPYPISVGSPGGQVIISWNPQ